MQSLLGLAIVCFLLKYASSQCDVLNSDGKAIDKASVHRCLQLYAKFEEALVGDEDNLYTLRELFLSTERLSPSLLTINYTIEGYNDSSNVITWLVDWSRSSLFKYVDPFIFVAIEPAVILLAFDATGAQIFPQYTELSLSLSLKLNITSLERNVTLYKEFQHALYTLNARIMAYAVTQGKLPSGWDGSNIGYSFDTDPNITYPLFFIILATLLLLVFSIMLSCFITKNFKVSRRMESLQYQYYFVAVFYSIGTVTLGLNLMELICNVVIAEEFAETIKNSPNSKSLFATKATFIIISLLVVSSFAIYGWKKGHTFPKFPCCLCCCCIHFKTRQKVIHSIIFISVSYFIFSLVTSICPVFLLIFVYPIKVVALLSFYGSSIFCTIIAFSFIFSYEMIKDRIKASLKSTSQVKSAMQRYALMFGMKFLYTLPGLAFVCLMCIYIEVLTGIDYHYTNSSTILKVISSLAPSAGLTILGNYGRKYLNFFHNRHSEELSLTTDSHGKTSTNAPIKDNKLKLAKNDTKILEQGDGKRKQEQSANESTHLLNEQLQVVYH